MVARDDSELVSQLQQRDEDAFIELIQRHDAALRRTARAFVSTAASADEVVQDTWLSVLDGLASFEGRSSIKTWIFQILINRARTLRVREARTVPASAILDDCHEGTSAVEPDLDERNIPNQLLLRKELAIALDQAMRELPERQRTVFVLRDALGWSPREVCHALSVNEINQRVLLHRARTRLRASLWHYRAA